MLFISDKTYVSGVKERTWQAYAGVYEGTMIKIIENCFMVLEKGGKLECRPTAGPTTGQYIT